MMRIDRTKEKEEDEPKDCLTVEFLAESQFRKSVRGVVVFLEGRVK
jgi:hypothetical protein